MEHRSIPLPVILLLPLVLASAATQTGRLVGEVEGEGRVEVFHDGRWGTVCDDNWTERETGVFCRSLGYSIGRVLARDQYEPGEGDILLDEVYCSGDEPDLGLCAHSDWGLHDCAHLEDVGAACTHADASLRLVGGSNVREGRVEVFYGGEWGTVCDDGWDFNDADVVCRSLGYHYGAAMTNARFGEGTGRIWLDDVECSGEEELLEQCPHNGWGVYNCLHEEDAGVKCF